MSSTSQSLDCEVGGLPAAAILTMGTLTKEVQMDKHQSAAAQGASRRPERDVPGWALRIYDVLDYLSSAGTRRQRKPAKSKP